jgi:urease accessory protein
VNLLLLSDGRFPAGGHAHSGGVEAAVMAGRVTGADSLGAFLAGRLATAGRVAAALAAAACAGAHDLAAVDAEAGARIPSLALRTASRVQGRHLLRAARAVLGPTGLRPGLPAGVDELHHPVAMGVVAAATDDLGPLDAARWAAYDSISGPAGAAVRLLGLDPFAAWAAVAALLPDAEALAARAAAGADKPLHRLPCWSAPLLDIGAEHHAAQEVRLFAS